MRILVTGAAGFIGSHLCAKLLENVDIEVVGVDTFIGPTPKDIKVANLPELINHPRFTFIEVDLMKADIDDLLSQVEVVYHLAGMPGVRSSWGNDFNDYVTNNINLTQKLLESAKNIPLKKFIYASTSSIYGEKSGMVKEDEYPLPLSPYGLTKLAGEHLCNVYRHSYNIPIVIVRFFTVYGPGQRPDMAFHRFIKQILTGEPLTIFGDGTQSRDFTYISDCVEGISKIYDKDHVVGTYMNIGGKERASVNEVIGMIEELTGKKANKKILPKVSGEPKHTWADITNAKKLIGYEPKVTLREGIAKEIEYIKKIYDIK